MASLTKRWRKSQCSEHDARVIHKWMTLDVSMRLFLEGATMQGSEWILWGHQKIDPCEGKKAGKTGWGPGTQPFIRTVTPHPFLGKWPAVHVTIPEMRLVLQWHGSQLSLAPAHPVKQEVQVQTVPLLSVGRRLLPLLMFHMRVKDSQKSTRWRENTPSITPSIDLLLKCSQRPVLIWGHSRDEGSSHRSHHCCFPRSVFSRSWSQGKRLDRETRHVDIEWECLNH